MSHAPLAAAAANPLFGLKPADWFNLAGLILGPTAAVLITSFRERSLRDRDQQMRILGILMANRVAPGGADWDAAFSLVPLHFNGDKRILPAWRNCLENFNTVAVSGNELYHLKERARKTNRLLFLIASELKIRVTEAELAAEGYISQGSTERNNAIRIIPNALVAIAETMKSQLEWLKSLKPPEP